MINTKNYFTLFAACFLLLFSSCTTVKISDAYLYASKLGRPNQKSENEVAFVFTTKKMVQLKSTLEVENKRNVSFKINAIFDESNKMLNVKNAIPKGTYRIVATSSDDTFELSENTVFLLSVDEKLVKVQTKLKEALNKK